MYKSEQEGFSKIIMNGANSTGKKNVVLRKCSCGSSNLHFYYEGKYSLEKNKQRTTISCKTCNRVTIIDKKSYGDAALEYNIIRDAESDIVRKYHIISITKDCYGKYCTAIRKTATLFPCTCNPHVKPELHKICSGQYYVRCSCGAKAEGKATADEAAEAWNIQLSEAHTLLEKQVIGRAA